MAPSLPIKQSSLYQTQDLFQSSQNSPSPSHNLPQPLHSDRTTSTQHTLLRSGSLQEVLILPRSPFLQHCFYWSAQIAIQNIRVGGLKTETDVPTALEAQSPKSRYHQRWFLVRVFFSAWRSHLPSATLEEKEIFLFL